MPERLRLGQLVSFSLQYIPLCHGGKLLEGGSAPPHPATGRSNVGPNCRPACHVLHFILFALIREVDHQIMGVNHAPFIATD